MEKPKQPKIIHRTVNKDMNRMSKVWDAFSKEVKKTIHQKLRNGFDKFDDSSPENLLFLRRHLVATVKMGMGGRKDLEEEIAFYLLLVWFNRLGKEKREALTDAWGW